MEDWRPILEFPGYSVSDLGRVRNDDTGRIMAMTRNQQGIMSVGLTKNMTQFKRSLTVLVANAFLPRPPRDTFDTPIHLDGDRTNCRADNLTWRPRWFAVMYHKQFGEQSMNPTETKIEDVDTGKVYKNSVEAAVIHGLLEHDVWLSIYNRTYVFPTFQTFRVVE